MNIDITSPSYTFSDLKAGDVFTITNGFTGVFMKVYSSGPVSFPYNAVNLKSGELAVFTNDRVVDYIDITLVKTRRNRNG